MKIILYMATTLNGYIAKVDHDTPWTKEEFVSYSVKVKEIGNLILGRTTYDLMYEEKAFRDLGDPFAVVVTSSTNNPERKNAVFVTNFNDGITILENQGFKTALVGGGGKLDTAALESGKLNEMFIDIEPLIFGKGIPLFAKSSKDLRLNLINTKRIGKSGIQLHYTIKK